MSLSKNVSRSQTKCLALLSPNVSRMMYRNAWRQSQTAVKDAGIKDGVNMSTNGTLVSKSASMWDESYGKAFEDYSNSEIAREIIINALYDAVVKHQGTYNNYYLQQVENDYGDSRAVAVRKKMVQYIGRIFRKYHTAKFDMSGHPILHDVFHEFEKHGELKFF